MTVDIAGRCPGCGLHVNTANECPTCHNLFTWKRPIKVPHCCPVCNGTGKVSRPPWVAGDQMTWDSSTIENYECHACDGSGIVWEKP